MRLHIPWTWHVCLSWLDLTQSWPAPLRLGNFQTPTPRQAGRGASAKEGVPPQNSPTKKDMMSNSQHDPVNHPSHYTEHASGVECIQITEHMNFCLGNAVKYIWRAGLKNDNAIEDLKKARWYVDRELERLSK